MREQDKVMQGCLALLMLPFMVAFTFLFYSSVLWGVLSLLNMADLVPLFSFKEIFAGVFVLQAFLGVRRCLIENTMESTLGQRLFLSIYTAFVYVAFAGLLAVFL